MSGKGYDDVFQAGRPQSPVVSEFGEAEPVAVGPGARGVFKATEKTAALKGREQPAYDKRKFRYDVVRGKGANLGFETSREDRMSAKEAGDLLERIHKLMGVDKEVEGTVRAFDKAMFFCHTVNGGSVLVAGRSWFSVPGVTMEFSFAKVRDILGVDQRRFFRAFADEIAEINKEVIASYDPYDPVLAEQWGWLQQVANDRALTRYPHLAHDSADACLLLAPAERNALAASKAMVIATTNNSADRMKSNSRAATADGYDSTVGERVV